MLKVVGYVLWVACFLGPPILFVLIYQSNSHPLRRFPGPWVARLTDGYAGVYAIQKRLHLATYRDHLKYGSVVRQAPNRLVFNTATALHDIYLNPRVTKSKDYLQSLLSTDRPSMFNALDRAQHGQKRRAVGQLLTERSMRIFRPTMELQVDVFLRQLLRSSQKSEIVNMTTRCQRLATDIVGHLAFGYPLNTQTEETNTIIPAGMKRTSYRINVYLAWPAVSFIDPIVQWFGRKEIPKFYEGLKKMIGARMSMPKDCVHDLYAVSSGDITPNGEKGLQGTDLWSEASFFVIAGGTTVTTLMSAVFFYVSHHPDVYKRLASEIRTTFSTSDSIVGGLELSSCRYLRAVIDETMRVAPPTTATPWRTEDIYSPSLPSSDEPFVVDGYIIPRGTAVGVSLYSLLHNPEYFPRPFEFRPERWLESKHEERANSMRRAFAPFALGDRGCAGKAMAYLEASLTVAKTLWYFDFETAPGELGKVGGGTPGKTDSREKVDEYQLYNTFTADHNGPNLVFTPRGDLWKRLEGGST